MIASVLALVLVATPADPSAENPEVQAEAPAEARAENQAEDPQEELVCRRRVIPAERIGERHRTVRTCKTRAEWDEQRNGSRRRN
jgi:hypothetical protein